jgi:Animal haem peroxidase
MHGWTLEGKTATGAPHLFGAPPWPAKVHNGAIISETGSISPDDRKKAHFLISKLSARAQLHDQAGRSRAAFWKDSLRADLPPESNPAIPSGYTYLLQLMAHDLVDTGPAALVAGVSVPNARARPLMLDTIYGAGPDGMPSIYNAADKVTDKTGFADLERAPRRYLRTAPLAATRPDGLRFCPFSDIARGSQPIVGGGSNCDALLADARNDAHAIMSQMAVLWHVLHNVVVARISEKIGSASRIEMAYRRFALAKAIVTLIYRRIVRDDLLGRILHPDVAVLYGQNSGWNGELFTEYTGVSLEFGRGAFRFGHAMVRNNYAINSMLGVNHAEGSFLSLNSARKPGEMPLKADWMIDWGLFFDMDSPGAVDPRLNFSNRIGPRYSNAVETSEEFEPKSKFDNRGLMHRDLKSSLYGGMWTVPALLDLMRVRLGSRTPSVAALFPPWEVTSKKLETWLGQQSSGDEFELGAADIASLAADPPLPFYVAFEAAMNPHSSTPDTTGMGQNLGPLGSVIVAETILGAMRSLSVVAGEQQLSLADAIKTACRDLLGTDAPDTIPGLTDTQAPPQSMADLLRFMKSAGAFGN